jgi:small conductance mechanosensitive channel
MPINWSELQPLLFTAILRVVGAVAALLIGRWLAGLARRSLGAALARTHASASIVTISTRAAFYGTLLGAAFIALVILGIPSEVLITVIGVVVVVAAVALRESLRDVAATVIFVIFQPFRAGDLIETNGVVGHVEEILMFSTVMITQDSRKLTIPNGNIQNSNLTNYSALDRIRLDLPVNVSYADDVDKAKATLLEIATTDARVLRDPAPVADVMQLGESGIQIVLRAYTTPDDFWALRPALTERIKNEFDRRGLKFPFPQLDLHVDTVQPDGSNAPAPVSGAVEPRKSQ